LGRCASVVAVLASLVGVISGFYPTLFFKIPEVGFIPYAMSGGPIPPYFDFTMFEDDSWLNDGDVVVAVGTKCGTNWMMTMVHELRTWNQPELKDFEDIFDVVPWAEFPQHPGIIGNAKARIELWDKRGQWNKTEYPFRVFKSHMTPKPMNGPKNSHFQCLDVVGRPKVKYIAMTRDGRDVMKSLEKFLRIHTKEFRTMWGGFPPPLENMEAAFDFCMPTENIPVLGYIKEWWPYRNHPNVLLLHYGDVHKDIPGTLRKVAEFIGLKHIPAKAFKEIEKRVSIEFMRARDKRYLMRFGHNLDKTIMSDKGGLIRTGGIGTAKDGLNEELDKRFEEHMQKHIGDDSELMKWYKDRMK